MIVHVYSFVYKEIVALHAFKYWHIQRKTTLKITDFKSKHFIA